jgi:hypothetical protein
VEELINLHLIGYDSPFGHYPSLLVPIIRDQEGKYGAVYLNENLEVCVDDISSKSEFSRIKDLDPVVQEQLKEFDYKRHKLFALSETQLKIYPAEEEKEFFKILLTKEETLLECDPFIRLSFAELTGDREIWSLELLRCDQYIHAHLPDSLPVWKIDSEKIRGKIKNLREHSSERHGNIPSSSTAEECARLLHEQFQILAARLNAVVSGSIDVSDSTDLHLNSLLRKVSMLGDLEVRLSSMKNLEKLYETLSRIFPEDLDYVRDYLVRKNETYLPLNKTQAEKADEISKDSGVYSQKNVESLEYSLQKIDECGGVIVESLENLPHDIDEQSLKVNLSVFFLTTQDLSLRVEKFSNARGAKEQDFHQVRHIDVRHMDIDAVQAVQTHVNACPTRKVSVRPTLRRRSVDNGERLQFYKRFTRK